VVIDKQDSDDEMPDIWTHSLMGDVQPLCKKCGHTFRLSSHLTAHMKKHRNAERCLCMTCGMTLGCARSLKIHMRTHTKNNTFDCKECGLVFCTPSGLVKHMRVHTGEKLTLSHVCTLCNTWLSTKDSLGAHMRRHQKHEKNKTVGMLCASE
jgi:uncharacterized Zn-finger protein